MQDTAHAAGTPMAHQGGPLKDPLEDARLPRAGSVPFEGVRFPRAGSASLEDPLPLEQAPPRSRVRPALDRDPPRSRAPRTRAPTPVRGHLTP
jgi:hypothetical protein